MKINKIIISFISAAVILLSTSVVSFAKVVGDKIVLGAAISLTGKYSSNGVHTQNARAPRPARERFHRSNATLRTTEPSTEQSHTTPHG